MASKSTLSPQASQANQDFDDLLGRLARKNDKDAFIALFEHFAPRIKSFLMRGGMSEDEAEELTQDTMLTMWQKAEQFDPYKASASTWIYTIARNKKIDRLRKDTVLTLDLDDLVMSGREPAAETNAHDWTQGSMRDRLSGALKQLPEEQAFLVRKAFYDDLSHGEIAETTKIPLGTVKSRLRLGLTKLRQILHKDDNSDIRLT